MPCPIIGIRRLLLAVMGLTAVASLPAVSAHAATPQATPHQRACPFDTGKALLAVECGRLKVPENYDEPAGRQIEIAYMVVRARKDRDPGNPVLLLGGGPGSASLVYAEMFVATPHIHDIVTDRDWVFFDQRGQGRSLPALRCPRGEEDYLKSIGACRDKFIKDGVDLSQYTSARSARDIEELRKALGVSQWNLWGISYGSRLAFSVAREFPATVRSMVHDGPSDPEGLEIVDDFRGAEIAIHKLLSKCAADAACAAEYPDLRARFLAALPRMRAQPLTVGEEQIDDNSLVQYLRGSLFSGGGAAIFEQRVRLLLAQIDAAARGDGARMAQLRQAMPQEPDPFDTNPVPPEGWYAMGQNLSIECNEERSFESPAAYRAAAQTEIARALFGKDALANAFQECALWPSGSADPVHKTRVLYDGPHLAFSGEFDPSLSGISGYEIEMAYPAARNVVFRNATHVQVDLTNYPPETVGDYHKCALKLAHQFFANPRARLDTSCAETRRLRLVP